MSSVDPEPEVPDLEERDSDMESESESEKESEEVEDPESLGCKHYRRKCAFIVRR